MWYFFFFSSRRRHTRCALVTGVQTCALPICICSGEIVLAIAMTEPGTGSDLQSIRTTAVRESDAYVINGSKTFITNGQHADLVLVVARIGTEKGARSLSLIGVETKIGRAHV